MSKKVNKRRAKVAPSKNSKGHRPDRDRAVFELLRAIKGVSAKELAAKSSYGSGYGKVSVGTIYKWRRAEGYTRYPQHATMAAVAKGLGLEYKLLRTNQPEGEE